MEIIGITIAIMKLFVGKVGIITIAMTKNNVNAVLYTSIKWNIYNL